MTSWEDVILLGGPHDGELLSVSSGATAIDLPAKNDRGFEKITYCRTHPASLLFVFSPEATQEAKAPRASLGRDWLEGDWEYPCVGDDDFSREPEPEGIEHPAAAALLIEIPTTNAWGQLTDFSFGRALPEDVA
jgi:hypothetical protein